MNKVANPEAIKSLQAAQKHNVYSTVTRNSPNADKLVDGAIQRQSV